MSYITKAIRPFNPDITFYSGQCFRWKKTDNNTWQGIADRKFAEISGSYPNISITCKSKDYDFWKFYFDGDYDYNKVHEKLLKDKLLKNAVTNNLGLILLRQPFFETLISFIISTNNNILRIKSIINNLCINYGDKIEKEYSFPSAEILAGLNEKDLLKQGCGYRSKYIIETSKDIKKGYDFNNLISMSLDDARNNLCKFNGVGKKVADCVLIYSLGRKDAFPVDTWIRKASINLFGKKLSDDLIRKRADEKFGKDAALAQQYLFITEREKK